MSQYYQAYYYYALEHASAHFFGSALLTPRARVPTPATTTCDMTTYAHRSVHPWQRDRVWVRFRVRFKVGVQPQYIHEWVRPIISNKA